jgi:hypothetical protein
MSLEAQSTNFASWVCSYIGLGLLRLPSVLDIVVFCNSVFVQLDRSNFEKRKCFAYDYLYKVCTTRYQTEAQLYRIASHARATMSYADRTQRVVRIAVLFEKICTNTPTNSL